LHFVRVEFHAQPRRDPVDEVEVGHDQLGQQDVFFLEACLAERERWRSSIVAGARVTETAPS